ncbi:Inositol polyphosphate multikinase [Ceratocystis fimbriata CBS 114723]|uniref:Kinase n=1 Tax=Ceratocystis fimbriata CBS 114723 TaxID=1035309 RepID=A0A2C5WZU3_9PEZI|nr:Inositol polyphosphate multikinase [Ceratocystis fimbriata CBS 114723]
MPSAPSVGALKHSDLQAYNAVAGHDGTMCDSSGKLFIKPCTATEIQFYEQLQAPEYEDLRYFTPCFFGTLSLDSKASEAVKQFADSGVLNKEATAALALAQAADSEGSQTEEKTGGKAGIRAAAETEPGDNVAELGAGLESEETNAAQPQSSLSSSFVHQDLEPVATVKGRCSSELPPQSPAHARSQSQPSPPETLSGTSSKSDSASVSTKWVPNGGKRIKTDTALVLENASYGFHHPNILDCKLGTRLWADDAPLEKRRRFEKIAATTTHQNFGFRIAGMRAWHGSTDPADLDSDGYMVYDRNYGRDHVTDDTLAATIRRFVFNPSAGITHELARAICAVFAHELEMVYEELNKHCFRIYSGSLLFIFEGDGKELERRIEAHNNAVDRYEQHMDNGNQDLIQALERQKSTAAALLNGDLGSMATLQVGRIGDSDSNEDNSGEEDGDSDGSDDDGQADRTHSLRLIDFAHASFVSSDQGPDQGLLLGVESLIKLFRDMAQEAAETEDENGNKGRDKDRDDAKSTDEHAPQKKRARTE